MQSLAFPASLLLEVAMCTLVRVMSPSPFIAIYGGYVTKFRSGYVALFWVACKIALGWQCDIVLE